MQEPSIEWSLKNSKCHLTFSGSHNLKRTFLDSSLGGRTNSHLLGFLCSPRSYFLEMFDLRNKICEVIIPVVLLLDRIDRKLDKPESTLCVVTGCLQSHSDQIQ